MNEDDYPSLAVETRLKLTPELLVEIELLINREVQRCMSTVDFKKITEHAVKNYMEKKHEKLNINLIKEKISKNQKLLNEEYVYIQNVILEELKNEFNEIGPNN